MKRLFETFYGIHLSLLNSRGMVGNAYGLIYGVQNFVGPLFFWVTVALAIFVLAGLITGHWLSSFFVIIVWGLYTKIAWRPTDRC